MSSTNNELHIAILEYLQQLAKNPGSLDADSIEVAAQCLAESLQIDMYLPDTQASFLSNKATNLQEVFINGLTGGSSSAPSVSSKTEADVSEADKLQAEELKNKGNANLSSAPQLSVDFYTQAIALNPFNHVYYNNRAVAYTKMSELELAVADAKKSIKLNDNYSKSHYRLALCYMELDKLPEAKTALETAIRVAKANGETTMISECNNKLNDLKSLEQKKKGSGGANAGGMDFSSLLGNMDLNALMQNPALSNMLGGMDINAMMQNPMMQNMMQNMMGGNMNLGDMMQQMQGGGNADDDDEEYSDEDDQQ